MWTMSPVSWRLLRRENALCCLEISCHSQLPAKRGSDGWSIDKSMHGTLFSWSFLGMDQGVVVPMWHLWLSFTSKPHIFLVRPRKEAVFSEQEHACRRHAILLSHWLTMALLFILILYWVAQGSSRAPGCMGKPGCSIWCRPSTSHYAAISLSNVLYELTSKIRFQSR